MAEVYIDVTTGAGETTYSGTENGSGTSGDPWTDYPSFVNHAANPVGTDNHVNIRGVITVGNAASGNQCDLGSLTDNASNNYTFRRWDGVPTTWAEMTDSGFQIPGATGGVAVFNFDSYSCENLLLEVTSGGTYRSDQHAYQGTGTVDRCVIICGGNCFRAEYDETKLTRSLCISKLNSCYYGANSGDWMDIYLYHNTFIIDGGSVAQILELRNFSHHLINNVMYVINSGSATNDVALVGTGSIDAAASEYNAGTLVSGSQPTDLQDNWLQLTADPFDDLVEFQPADGGALDTNLGSSNNPPGFTVDGFGNNYASPNPEMGWRAAAGAGGGLQVLRRRRM